MSISVSLIPIQERATEFLKNNPRAKLFMGIVRGNVESRIRSEAVDISKRESLKSIANHPLFRYSTSRLERLLELVTMLDHQNRNRIKGDEKSLIIEMHSAGHSDGEIASTLWAEYGIARRPSTIYNFLKRNGSHIK